MKLPSLALLITASLLPIFSSRADDATVAAKLAKIPPAAAEALKKAAGTAKIDKVNIEKDGKTTVYEVVLIEAGQPNREVSVTADGKLNAEEETMPLDKLPEVVRKAIEAGAKGATIERVMRIKRAAGGVTYEAAYNAKGKKTEVEYLEDGKPKPEEK